MNRLPVWTIESRDDVASFNHTVSWSDSDRAFQGTISSRMNYAVVLKLSHLYVESEAVNAPQILETVRWMRLHWWECLCAPERQTLALWLWKLIIDIERKELKSKTELCDLVDARTAGSQGWLTSSKELGHLLKLVHTYVLDGTTLWNPHSVD